MFRLLTVVAVVLVFDAVVAAPVVSDSVSAQDGIVALRKAHTRSVPSLSTKAALETVPIFV